MTTAADDPIPVPSSISDDTVNSSPDDGGCAAQRAFLEYSALGLVSIIPSEAVLDKRIRTDRLALITDGSVASFSEMVRRGLADPHPLAAVAAGASAYVWKYHAAASAGEDMLARLFK